MGQGDTHTAAQWRQLFSLAAAGDPVSENLLFERLRRGMIAMAQRALRTRDVDDVVQDALLVVYRKYRELAVGFEDQIGFERWWRRILHHRIGNDIRRRRFESEHRAPAEYLQTVCSLDASDRRCEDTERRDLLTRALRHLTTTQRSILRASAGRGALPPLRGGGRDACYARTYRARKALRQAMQLEAATTAGELTAAPTACRRT